MFFISKAYLVGLLGYGKLATSIVSWNFCGRVIALCCASESHASFFIDLKSNLMSRNLQVMHWAEKFTRPRIWL